MKRALTGVLLLATFSCSRPDTPKTDGTETGHVHAPTPSDSSPTGSAASSPSRVPVFEDPDEAAAHQITEQNLESELDRLEREIQAE